MKRKSIAGILLAVALIALGVLLLGVMAFGWKLYWFAGWWALAVSALAVVSVIRFGPRFWNSYLFLAGLATFAYCQRPLFFIRNWVQYWYALAGLALITLGISLIAHMLRPRKINPPAAQDSLPKTEYAYTPPADHHDSGAAHGKNAPFSSEEFPNHFAIFSSETCRSDCKQLRGARFTAIFGGVLADFREADFSRPISVEVYSLFGGVDIIVPPNVRVECTGTSVFGGCNAKAIAGRPYDPTHPPLTIRCLNVFGGTDVK